MRTTWNFYSAGRLLFGCGAVRQTAACMAPLRVRKAFVVSDAALAKAGAIQRVVDPLREADIEVQVFEGGQPEPAIEVALAAAEQAKQFGPDAIVGIGG